MVLLKCTECGREVSENDKKCPKCGEIVITYRDWVITAGVIAVFLILGYWLISAVLFSKPSSSSNTPPAPTSIDACIASESLVEKILKSPGSAKFPDCVDQQIANIGANRWQVSSYVDSQNGFGALLRNYYTVVVEDRMDANETWELVSSNFSEQ